MTTSLKGFPFDRVGIVGLGLMGGSLARDLKDLSNPPLVRALSSDPEELARGVEVGAVDEAALDPISFFSELDLVVYCTPLLTTLALLEVHQGFVEPTTVISDVVSLKAPVLEKVGSLGLRGAYVGSHPMAGREGSGFSASRVGLFKNARVWLVAEGAPPASVLEMKEFWARFGARPRFIDALDHDTRMAWVSHLPQLTSNALAQILEASGFRKEDLGSGATDMTRLAGSSPEMWEDLLRHAPPDLPVALEALEGVLSDLRKSIQEGRFPQVSETMAATRKWSGGKP